MLDQGEDHSIVVYGNNFVSYSRNGSDANYSETSSTVTQESPKRIIYQKKKAIKVTKSNYQYEIQSSITKLRPVNVLVKRRL